MLDSVTMKFEFRSNSSIYSYSFGLRQMVLDLIEHIFLMPTATSNTFEQNFAEWIKQIKSMPKQ